MRTGSRPELAQALAASLRDLRRAAVFSLAGALLVLAPSAYMLEVYERVLNSRSAGTLLMLTLLVAGAIAVMSQLEWARLQVLQHAAVAFDRRIGERVFGAMFDAALARTPAGTPQAMVDLQALRDFLTSPALLAALEAPAALVLLAVLAAIHPLLAWACLGGALLQTLLAWCNDAATRPPLQAANGAATISRQEMTDAVRAAQVVQGLGMQAALRSRWLARQRDLLALQCAASDRGGVLHALGKFAQVTMGSVLIGLGAWLLMRGELPASAGLVVAASILGARAAAPLLVLLLHWRSVVQARTAWSRLSALLEAAPPRTPGLNLPRPAGALRAEQVVAAPPGAPAPVLRGISFELQPGELLVVIGPSGAGKSVLARVLAGAWPCTAGAVRLDQAEVFRWDKSSLGPHLGYLAQDVQLFEGTVADNIARFGVPEPARLHAAAHAAGLHGFIAALEQGYDTALGADGAPLSGGQRQRVALARALYGEPAFVVLDEPDASLDEAGDAALLAALQALKARGATAVVVTHRAGLLRCADKLLVLRQGQVQAFGPRDEVLRALGQPVAQRIARAAGGLAPAAIAA